MFTNDNVLTGDISRDQQTASVPSVKLQMINLILEGSNAADNDSTSPDILNISTNIAQLIHFNSVKTQCRREVKHLRHAANNEPPLPVLVGLLVRTKTRKKGLVNQLAKEGLSVKYE